ncbi:MAG: hypothetical protein AABZ39_05370 [Spirochaetota bacterium]
MENIRLSIFYIIYAFARVFRFTHLYAAGFAVKLCYLYIKKIYIDLSLFYYFKDPDDVGLFECFILDDKSLDYVAHGISDRSEKLNKQSFIINLARSDTSLAAQKHDDDVSNVSITTNEKKRIIAEKAIELNEVLTYFAKRIDKVNRRLYRRVNWLYRTLYCSVYKRDRSFFAKEHVILEKPDLDTIIRMATEGTGK